MDFNNVRDFTIDASETEAYVTAQSNLGEKSLILKITKKDGEWKNITVASFSGIYSDLEPFLSPDDLKLYFASNRPVHQDSTNVKDMDIWYVERSSISSAWSIPKNIGIPVNTDADEFYPSVAKNGNMYFTSTGHGAIGEDDIFVSTYVDGNYQKPIGLKGNVNTKSYEYNAFISPDEDYLIFGGYGRNDGYGSGDLYISFKNADNSWATPQNLGDTINSKFMDYCPYIVKSGNLLFFTSRRSSLESTDKMGTIKDVLQAFNSYENGLSRIYKTTFDLSVFKN